MRQSRFITDMNKTVILKEERHRQTAEGYLKDVPLQPVHEVIIKPHKVDRSSAQNRLLWKWCTEIGDQTGEIKEEVNDRYKQKFLVHIFERDNDGFAEMLQAVRQVHKWGEVVLAKVMEREILKLTSTRNANVDQFREYLNSLEIDARSSGLTLSNPDDLYSYAMKETK